MTDPIICPHCDHHEHDWGEHDVSLGRVSDGATHYIRTTCLECNEPFVIAVSVSVYVETTKELPESIAALLGEEPS